MTVGLLKLWKSFMPITHSGMYLTSQAILIVISAACTDLGGEPPIHSDLPLVLDFSWKINHSEWITLTGL